MLQKLLKDEHHRRIGKGDTSVYKKHFLQYIDCIFLFDPNILRADIVAGAHFCDGRPAVNVAQQAPDDQAAADSKHDRLRLPLLTCSGHPT